VDAQTGLGRCPFCGADTVDGPCGSCGALRVAQGTGTEAERFSVGRPRRLAVSRRRSADDVLEVWRAGDHAATAGRREDLLVDDDPGLTFEPIKVGPDTCSGCETTAVFVVDGQAAVYSLEGCDDDWCFYENPQGIA
jgi:uncharacterized protein (UPF0212 family)